MTEAVALLIVTLSGQGYWLGGREAAVSIQWATKGAHPEATLVWQLGYGSVRVAEGRMAMPCRRPTSSTGLTAIRKSFSSSTRIGIAHMTTCSPSWAMLFISRNGIHWMAQDTD